jgi:hypothetical protein
VFSGFMFLCSFCSIRANAAVFESVCISDPSVHLLICYGRCLKLVAARPVLLNHIAGWDRIVQPNSFASRISVPVCLRHRLTRFAYSFEELSVSVPLFIRGVLAAQNRLSGG